MVRRLIYDGLLKYFEEGKFFRYFLQEHKLTNKDHAFALEVGQGVIKRYGTLQAISKLLQGKKRLSLKRKEKLLLYSALYQRFFLSKVPLYAIVNETVEIAKKNRMTYFAKFLNAYLKALPETCELPTPSTLEKLSEYYSYPKYYIELLQSAFSNEDVIKLLECGNQKPKTFYRVRKGEGLDPFWDEPFCEFKNPSSLEDYTSNPNIYIQNPSSFYLIKEALPYLKKPKTVLDLCAAPGGKALGIYDLLETPFELSLNDPSEKRLRLLKENMEKYSIECSYTSFLGEEYQSEKKFDLIIIDAPCSNSGTLSRKAEARWRLEKIHLTELLKLQRSLVTHALSLLADGGQILYLTCSILPDENQDLIDMLSTDLNLKQKSPHFKITPSDTGLDGGYCCVVEKSV